MTIEYPDLSDYLAVAATVARLESEVLIRSTKLDRAAWVTLRLIIEINGWVWDTYPSVDDAERAVHVSVADPMAQPHEPGGSTGCSRRRRMTGWKLLRSLQRPENEPPRRPRPRRCTPRTTRSQNPERTFLFVSTEVEMCCGAPVWSPRSPW